MNDIRKIWVLPLLSGIITIIALITPTAVLIVSNEYFDYLEIQWMWGLLYYDLKDFLTPYFLSGFEFITHIPVAIILGIITSITMLCSAILSIVSTSSFRKGSQQFASIKKFWIISGLLQIASGIIYLIGIQISFMIYKLRTSGIFVSFWENRFPNFGVLAPIVCGVLCIIGVIVGTKILKRGEVIAPLEQIKQPKLSPLTQVNSDPQLNRTVELSRLNFCPECGYKISVMNSKFCTDCGVSLKID